MLTTSQLADVLGIPAGTLRMWESRYGFPQPQRLPSGHHRYSAEQTDQLREVLRLRGQGLALGSAIERVQISDGHGAASVFAGLRDARPELPPVAMSKRGLLQITRAIEDEFHARGASGVLIASFQHPHNYRQVERRWLELARTASFACVIAGFETYRTPVNAPIEVPVVWTSPMYGEWVLIADAPDAHACVAGWEHPTNSPLPDMRRRFEVIWSADPDAVRTARRIATGLITKLAPQIAERIPTLDESATIAGAPDLRFETDLTHRMVRYLAGR